MAAGEEDNNKKEQDKGFAGLSSLLSEVDAPPPPAAKRTTTNSTGTVSGASRPAPQPTRQPASHQQPHKPPRQPGSGTYSYKWILGVNVIIIIGVLWLIGQSNNKPIASTPPKAPANSAPSTITQPWRANKENYAHVKTSTSSGSTTNADSDLMSDGDGATYRVPSFRLPELNADRRAAKSSQQKARDMDAQVERQKIVLDEEKRQVEKGERQHNALGSEIEQQRLLVDSSNQYEVDSFNSKIREYNANRTRLRRQINKLNIDVDTYNNLVRRAQTLEQQANHLVDIYNSKLEQYGTRQ